MLELCEGARPESEIALQQSEENSPQYAHAIDLMWCDIHGVFVKGWAFLFGRSDQTFWLSSGDNRMEISDRHERPDLRAFFPGQLKTERAGFSAYLPCEPFKPVFLTLQSDGDQVTVAVAVPPHLKASTSSLSESAENNALHQFAAEMRRRRAIVLEIGARKVSPIPSDFESLFAPDCTLLSCDIHPASNIDIVADAHFLSEFVEPASLDGIFSVAVMEHLVAPWLVAAQINRALKVGGLSLQVLPQTWPVHEMPNDFWRMSDAGLKSLFGDQLGFEILDSGMSSPMAIYPSPLIRSGAFLEMPCHPGFGNTFVLARKVRDLPDDEVKWPVDRLTLQAASAEYPRHES